jgi:tetratricopeptide (TPR) repeat protein
MGGKSMTFKRLAPLGGVLLLAAISMGCAKLKARDQLNKGVAAFRAAQFQQAITHFQQAVKYDDTLLNARLYLATAYYQLYVPGGESEDNIKIGKQAIAAYEDVLNHNPNVEQQTNALGSIAQIYYNMKEFEKAKELQKRIVQIDPNNPDPYGWIGQLDWSVCYPRRMKVRKELNIANPTDPKNPGVLPPLPEKARAALAEENEPLIEDGIQALTKAVELRPNDVTSLSYLNLMYREKADIEADKADREADLQKADDLTQKALAAMKAQQAASASAVH